MFPNETTSLLVFFAIFGEEIVRIWCRDEKSRFADIGRPTFAGARSGLDFTFVDHDRRVFIAELKCEITYESYRSLVLESPDQLLRHARDSAAFAAFLNVAKNPIQAQVKVRGVPTKVDGAILIWGVTTDEAKYRTCVLYGFHDILSLQDICNDLVLWKNSEFLQFIQNRKDWCDTLMNSLLSASID